MMCSLKILLPVLLVAAPPLCSSFAPPVHPAICTSRASSNCVLRVTEDDNNNTRNVINNMERVSKVAGSALVALTLTFSQMTTNVPLSDNTISTIPSADAASSSILISRGKTISEDDVLIKELEKETKATEKEAKTDARKARVEKSREAFFEYEAKQAEEQEARIEAAEKKAELEVEKDKKIVEELQALEQKAEREAALAQTKQEKLAKQKEAKALLKKEREIEKKERAAERAERIYLAEEETEKKIVQKKEEAAIAEEKKFEEVEKEYERVAELAKEEEAELSLLKGLKSPKK